jgi:hypothetical protein
VIAGNTVHGIHSEDAVLGLYNNLIGLNRSASPLGNGGCGIRVESGSLTLGKAPYPGNANVIGANADRGVLLTGPSWLNAQGNYIGCTATLAAADNGSHGIEQGPWVGDDPQQVSLIGGTAAGMGNFIAYNGGDGVYIPAPLGISASYLSVLGNSIFANTGLGIDAGANGVTLNDVGDTDLRLQNYPFLTAATPTKVLGTLNSTPLSAFRIEIYRAEPIPGNYGTGRYYLGAVETVTDASGTAPFGLTGLSLTAGQQVTATATLIGTHPDPANTARTLQDTSEFCLNRTVGTETTTPTLSLHTGTLNVSENAGNAVFTVTRGGNLAGPLTVNYATTPGTAADPGDFTSRSGTIRFAGGQTTATISIPVTNDNVYEVPQQFLLHLSQPSAGALLTSSAVVVINDDEAYPSLSLPATLSYVEGHGGWNPVPYAVTLSGPLETPVQFRVYANNGTAVAPDDYYTEGFGHTIPAGATQFVLTNELFLQGDTTVEADETLQLYFNLIQGASPGNTTATVTILDDDDTSAGVLQFSSTSYTAAENGGSATFTVTRTGGTGGAASVNFARTGGTATAGSDFNAAGTAGTLHFADGQGSAIFTVSLTDDYTVEGPETIQFQLSAATGATLGSPATATLTLNDNDQHHTISGRVQLADGSGLAGATVILTGSQNATLTTDNTGNYSFPNIVSGLNYAVVVIRDGWSFTPPSRGYNNLTANQTAQDYTGEQSIILPELFLHHLGDGRKLLMWPEEFTGWTLMRSTTLAPGSWQPVGITPTLRSGHWQVIVNDAPRAFFRLDSGSGGGGGDEEM